MDDRTSETLHRDARTLHGLALGELAETDDAAVTLLERSPAARERLVGLRDAIDALERARADRDADLAAGPVPEEDAFVAACRAVVAPAPVRRFPWRAAAAAALLVGAFLGWRALGGVEAPPATTDVAVGDPAPPRVDVPASLPASLGAHGLECSAPVGEVERYGTFQWSGTLELGESFDLLVTDRTREGARPEVVAEDLLDPLWEPTEAEGEALPDALTWTVRVRGADGRLTERSVSADASRR